MVTYRFERDEIVTRVEPTLKYEALGDADIVIEAVFEDIKVKHQVVKETEAVCRCKTFFIKLVNEVQ